MKFENRTPSNKTIKFLDGNKESRTAEIIDSGTGGTPLNAENLNKGNWRDDTSLEFSTLPNNTLPGKKSKTTAIATTLDGKTYIIPPSESNDPAYLIGNAANTAQGNVAERLVKSTTDFNNYNSMTGWGDPGTYRGNVASSVFASNPFFIAQARSESSGIAFDGDGVMMWSPVDKDPLTYYDEDDGSTVFRFDSSGNTYNKAGKKATYLERIVVRNSTCALNSSGGTTISFDTSISDTQFANVRFIEMSLYRTVDGMVSASPILIPKPSQSTFLIGFWSYGQYTNRRVTSFTKTGITTVDWGSTDTQGKTVLEIALWING